MQLFHTGILTMNSLSVGIFALYVTYLGNGDLVYPVPHSLPSEARHILGVQQICIE